MRGVSLMRQSPSLAFATWRWGDLEFRSFFKFSPNLQNSEPPSSESKERILQLPLSLVLFRRRRLGGTPRPTLQPRRSAACHLFG